MNTEFIKGRVVEVSGGPRQDTNGDEYELYRVVLYPNRSFSLRLNYQGGTPPFEKNSDVLIMVKNGAIISGFDSGNRKSFGDKSSLKQLKNHFESSGQSISRWDYVEGAAGTIEIRTTESSFSETNAWTTNQLDNGHIYTQSENSRIKIMMITVDGKTLKTNVSNFKKFKVGDRISAVTGKDNWIMYAETENGHSRINRGLGWLFSIALTLIAIAGLNYYFFYLNPQTQTDRLFMNIMSVSLLLLLLFLYNYQVLRFRRFHRRQKTLRKQQGK
jgi:hypothetical protein